MRSNRTRARGATKPALLAFPGRFRNPADVACAACPAPYIRPTIGTLHDSDRHRPPRSPARRRGSDLWPGRVRGRAPGRTPHGGRARPPRRTRAPRRHDRVPRPAGVRVRHGSRRLSGDPDYRGYTKSICTSINHVVCHGIPNDKPLREGDILNIDYTLILDGWHGDSSRMYFVGEAPRRAAAVVRRHL